MTPTSAVLSEQIPGTTTDDPAVFWEEIDPDRARTYLDENDANRGLRSRVVNAYARDMANGEWLTTGETIKFSRTGELLDGQHRLYAILESKVPQRMLVVTGLDPRTRAVIDTGAPRTAADALRLEGLGGNDAFAAAAAARLLVLWRTGRMPTMSAGMRHEDRATHSEILDMVRAEPDLLDAVDAARRDYTRTGIPAGPGAMARVVLYAIDATDAETFFDALAGYKTDGVKDPRSVLLFTIRQLRATGQMRKPGESVGLIFAAWNAWRDGQKITTLAVRDAKGKYLPMPDPA